MSLRNFELEESIYRFVLEYSNSNGVSPSVREIASKCNCAPSNVQRYLNRLIESGRLTRKGIRNFATKYNSDPITQVPLLGNIACGWPIYADENIESYIPVKSSFLGAGDFFALVARGDSMIEAGINDGDIVFIRHQDTAEDGQIVVALLGEEATLKTYKLDKKTNKVILHPENKEMDDIIVDNVSIQGIAVKVIKNL